MVRSFALQLGTSFVGHKDLEVLEFVWWFAFAGMVFRIKWRLEFRGLWRARFCFLCRANVEVSVGGVGPGLGVGR